MGNTCNCASAEELLEKISPIGNFKSEKLNSPWLFRGQGQDWDLIPSLYRPKNETVKTLIGDKENKPDAFKKVEEQLIIDFFNIADKRGLVLPDDSQRLRDFFSKLDFSGKRIEDEALSVMALAQHYGVPTRLLDWTLHPYIAAFFAAEQVYKNKYNPLIKDKDKYASVSCLVVWAFYFPRFAIGSQAIDNDYVFRTVTAPSASNANLKAQQGVFTLIAEKHAKNEDGKRRPFNVLVDDYVDSLRAYLPESKMFSARWGKFTLPVSEASRLLYLLAKLDVTPSSVYPGYASVVSDMIMQRKFENV